MTMNKPIRNIMFFALIMVIILMANLSIVHVFKEDEYANNPLNRRMFIKAKLQPRGKISAGGIVLAESKQEEENGIMGSLSRMIFGTKKRGEQLTVTEELVSGVAKAVGRNIRSQITKQIMRGILGAFKK